MGFSPSESVKKRLLTEVESCEQYYTDHGLAPTGVERTFYTIIQGHVGTPYEGGSFVLSLEIPQLYPYKYPKIRFHTKIFHPEVDSDGWVSTGCIKDRYDPTKGLLYIAEIMLERMTCKTCDYCMNSDAFILFHSDKNNFIKRARDDTVIHAHNPALDLKTMLEE